MNMPCDCVQGERSVLQSFCGSGYTGREMESEVGPCNTEDASINTSSKDSGDTPALGVVGGHGPRVWIMRV